MVAHEKHEERVSLAAFMAMPHDGDRHELVRGEVRTMPPPGSTHGVIETALLSAIDCSLYERALALGWTLEAGLSARHVLVGFVAGGEFGVQFALPDDIVQVRGADGVYVPAEQVRRVAWDGQGYFPAVPALVMEIISPSKTAADVNEKVQDYLAGGASRVWCLYPERRLVHIHDSEAPTRVVRGHESLTDEGLLPGFILPLGLVFPDDEG